MSMIVVMRDSDHPLMYDQTESDSEATRHEHWSRLTVSDGTVTDVDWGYHSSEEAFRGKA